MSTWKTLGYAGLIPFFGCLTLSAYIDNLGFNSQQVFIAYSAVILSFIAGSLWRIDDNNEHKSRQLISNIFSLIAFSALCVHFLAGLIILASSYPLILFFEYKMTGQASMKKHYMIMRCKLTLLVFIVHIFAVYLWHF
jgi:ABC-type Fe3+-siderophore transport system permease subunit